MNPVIGFIIGILVTIYANVVFNFPPWTLPASFAGGFMMGHYALEMFREWRRS